MQLVTGQLHRKAFSTRAFRLTAIGIFPGAILFLYSVPSSTPSRLTVKVASVFYTAVIPTLNPVPIPCLWWTQHRASPVLLSPEAGAAALGPPLG